MTRTDLPSKQYQEALIRDCEFLELWHSGGTTYLNSFLYVRQICRANPIVVEYVFERISIGDKPASSFGD